MIYLFDNQKNVFGEIPRKSILNYEQKKVLGGSITAAVTAEYAPEIEQVFYFGSKDIDNENIFWLYRITSQKKQDGKIVLTGIYLLFDELQGEVIRDLRPQDVPPATALSRILEGSVWEVGVSTATGTASGNFYYESRLASFYDFLKRWQVEFSPRIVFTDGKITGRYIDIHDYISGNYGKRYEYGDRLIKVVAEQANEGIYTALIGRGKGEEVGDGYGRRITFTDVAWSTALGDPVSKPLGQDFVALPSAVAIYGLREAVIEFPEIEDPEELLHATYEELIARARPKVEFSADVVETDQVELGEIVTVIRDDLGIRYQTRVFELVRNFLNSKVKSFRFGDRVFATAAERIKQDKQETKAALKEQESRIAEALSAITVDFFNEDGYNYELRANNDYGLPAGYYSFDRPIDQDPTKVVYMGAGKVLIATGKDPNGEWVWRTAVTPEGIVGSEIISHSITANKLAADVGQSLDLSSNVAITSRVTKEEILTDPEIQDALKGADGQDATKTWTHIKFARDGTGTDMSDLPEDRTYIGIGMEKPYPTPSTDHLEYYWGTFRNSSYGISLRDGKFAWVKFADTNKGYGMSNDPEGKRYVGIAIKTSQDEGNNAYDYDWRPIYEREIIVQPTEPTEVYPTGQIWLDTSMVPSQLKRWTGSEWDVVNDTSQLENILSGKLGEQDVQDLIEAIAGSMISTSETEISQTTDAITQRVTQTIAALDAYGRHLTALEEKQEMVWRLTADGIEFGETGNPIRTVQKPDRYAFIDQAGNEVAYFSNWELFVNSLHVPITGTFKHGPLMWSFRSNGNYDLVRVGE